MLEIKKYGGDNYMYIDSGVLLCVVVVYLRVNCFVFLLLRVFKLFKYKLVIFFLKDFL